MSKKELFLRVLLFAALSSLVVLVLAGCSTSNSPAPTVTVTESSAPNYGTPEDAFINSLRTSGNVYLENIGRASALKVAHETCSLLDQGYTLIDILQALVDSGQFTTSDQQQAVGFLIGAGIQAFCPEYSYQVDNL